MSTIKSPKKLQSTSMLPSAHDLSNEMTKSVFISSSTLRQFSPSISFTKASRFSNYKSVSQTDFFVPKQNSGRSTMFGYGEKRLLPRYVINNALTNPSPSKYNTRIEISSPKKGKSFGLPFKYQAKQYAEHLPQYISPEMAKGVPGVGTYNVGKNIGKGKKSALMVQRSEMYRIEDFPGSNHYKPGYKLLNNSRFSGASIGKGNKYDFTKIIAHNPGPGAYKAPSQFDKFESPLQQQHRKLRISRLQTQQYSKSVSQKPQFLSTETSPKKNFNFYIPAHTLGNEADYQQEKNESDEISPNQIQMRNNTCINVE